MVPDLARTSCGDLAEALEAVLMERCSDDERYMPLAAYYFGGELMNKHKPLLRDAIKEAACRAGVLVVYP